MLRSAVDKYYVTELVVDGFPITDFLGIKMDKEAAKIYVDMAKELAESSEADYGYERMWGEYESGAHLEDSSKKEANLKYFLVTNYGFVLSHDGGEIRAVHMRAPALTDMLDITEDPPGGKFLKAKFSFSVGGIIPICLVFIGDVAPDHAIHPAESF